MEEATENMIMNIGIEISATESEDIPSSRCQGSGSEVGTYLKSSTIQQTLLTQSLGTHLFSGLDLLNATRPAFEEGMATRLDVVTKRVSAKQAAINLLPSSLLSPS
jgi:hypothetical protein